MEKILEMIKNVKKGNQLRFTVIAAENYEIESYMVKITHLAHWIDGYKLETKEQIFEVLNRMKGEKTFLIHTEEGVITIR